MKQPPLITLGRVLPMTPNQSPYLDPMAQTKTTLPWFCYINPQNRPPAAAHCFKASENQTEAYLWSV